MKTKIPTIKKETLTAVGLLAILSMGCGRTAGNNEAEAEDRDSVPEVVSQMIAAIEADDSVAFAALVSYPLERPYPLKDIENQEEMQSYYKVMVDDSLHRAVRNTGKGHWNESGWRGWTIDRGQYVWVGDSLYEVSYVSLREDSLRKVLRAKEIASLAPDLRKGWRPEFVMQDPQMGTLYRIDVDAAAKEHFGSDAPEDGKDTYRLVVYTGPREMRSQPHMVMKGHRYVEGSEGQISYMFGGDGKELVPDSAEVTIEPYSPDTGAPRLYRRRRNPKTGAMMSEERELKKIYWLDVLPTDTLVLAAPLN